MSRLVWDKTSERLYETGVRNAVLYPQSAGGSYSKGVAWNGITSISENPSGADATALYADDIKYLNLRAAEEFGATIEAYTYPDEFAICDGSASLAEGVIIGQQARPAFGLCYRTAIGNDVSGDTYGYKLHLIYGCTASPSERSYQTINDSPEAITFSWEITTTPVPVEGYKNTALVTIDSTKIDPAALKDIEDALYGTENDDPRLLLPSDILDIINGDDDEEDTYTITVNANGDGATASEASVETGTDGKIASLPTATWADHVFAGWFTDASEGTEVTTATVFTQDSTIYAHWTTG